MKQINNVVHYNLKLVEEKLVVEEDRGCGIFCSRRE